MAAAETTESTIEIFGLTTPYWLAQVLLMLGALAVAALSAWATLRAFGQWRERPTPLMLGVLLAWMVPVLGPILVLVWVARERRGLRA